MGRRKSGKKKKKCCGCKSGSRTEAFGGKQMDRARTTPARAGGDWQARQRARAVGARLQLSMIPLHLWLEDFSLAFAFACANSSFTTVFFKKKQK